MWNRIMESPRTEYIRETTQSTQWNVKPYVLLLLLKLSNPSQQGKTWLISIAKLILYRTIKLNQGLQNIEMVPPPNWKIARVITYSRGTFWQKPPGVH